MCRQTRLSLKGRHLFPPWKWAGALAAIYLTLAFLFIFDHAGWNAAPEEWEPGRGYAYQPGAMPFLVAGWMPIVATLFLWFWTVLRPRGASVATIMLSGGLCGVTIHSQMLFGVAWFYNLFGQPTAYFGDATHGHALSVSLWGSIIGIALAWGLLGIYMLSHRARAVGMAWLAAYPVVSIVIFALASLDPWDDLRYVALTNYAWPVALFLLWLQWPARVRTTQTSSVEPQETS